MFERFTAHARTVVVLAQEEARGLGHTTIGTEHVLLGLMAGPSGVAGTVLSDAGWTIEAMRAEVAAAMPPSPKAARGHLPFSPRAKKVLELALREAIRLGHDYIGTEHILLGVIREGQGLGAEILAARGPGLDALRAAVLDRVGGPADDSDAGFPPGPRRGGWFGRRMPPPPGWSPRMGDDLPFRMPPPLPFMTPAADKMYARVRALADPAGPVGTDDFLRALASAENSVAAKVFERLGVTTEQLLDALDATPREGTSDEQPAPPRQHVSIREVDGKLTIEVEGDGIAAMKEAILRSLHDIGDRLPGDNPPAAGA